MNKSIGRGSRIIIIAGTRVQLGEGDGLCSGWEGSGGLLEPFAIPLSDHVFN